MNSLFIIPARSGSKGIPHKNIKKLAGKPLLCYAIDVARQLALDEDICVSTDGDEIIKVAEDYGLPVSYKRPDSLATDYSGSYGLIIDALNYYILKGRKYDTVVLLQPTSPFRQKTDIQACLNTFSKGDFEMVVSVIEAKTNPFYNCYLERNNGLLSPLLENAFIVRRQDAPIAYEYNGAVYVMSVQALRKKDIGDFTRVGFTVMNELHSIDLDNMLDWKFAEMIIKEHLLDD